MGAGSLNLDDVASVVVSYILPFLDEVYLPYSLIADGNAGHQLRCHMATETRLGRVSD